MNNLERRFVVALRPKYNTENIIDYTFKKNIVKCYVILKDYGEEYLAVELNYFKQGDRELQKLSRKKYPFLKDDSIINNYVTVINANYLINYSQEIVDKHDFDLIMTRLKGEDGAIVEKEDKELFENYCIEYYSKTLKEGSLVNIRTENGYELYYVKEKYYNSFLGIKLHYDYKTGLTVDGEEKVIPYDTNCIDITYEEEYSKKVLSMINKHKL